MFVEKQLQEIISDLEFLLIDCQGLEFDHPRVESFVASAIVNVEMAISDLHIVILERQKIGDH